MVKVEVTKTNVDGVDFINVFLVMKSRGQDRKFLVVPFPGDSPRMKAYFYNLVEKRSKN